MWQDGHKGQKMVLVDRRQRREIYSRAQLVTSRIQFRIAAESQTQRSDNGDGRENTLCLQPCQLQKRRASSAIKGERKPAQGVARWVSESFTAAGKVLLSSIPPPIHAFAGNVK